MKRFIENLEVAFQPGDNALQALQSCMKVVRLEKDQLYLKEGDVSVRIGFVEQGALRQFYGSPEKEYCNDFYFENSVVCCFGSMLSGQPSAFNIAAIEKCEILSFDYVDVLDLIEEHTALRQFSSFLLQEHILQSEKRYAELLRSSPEERFRRLLENHPKIFRRIPLRYVASYLNITPETLSRYRAKL